MASMYKPRAVNAVGNFMEKVMFRKKDKTPEEVISYLLDKLKGYQAHLKKQPTTKEVRNKLEIVDSLVGFMVDPAFIFKDEESEVEVYVSTGDESTDDSAIGDPVMSKAPTDDQQRSRKLTAQETLEVLGEFMAKHDIVSRSAILESRRAQKDPKTFYERFMNWLHQYTKHSTGAQLVKDIKKHLPARSPMSGSATLMAEVFKRT